MKVYVLSEMNYGAMKDFNYVASTISGMTVYLDKDKAESEYAKGLCNLPDILEKDGCKIVDKEGESFDWVYLVRSQFGDFYKRITLIEREAV